MTTVVRILIEGNKPCFIDVINTDGISESHLVNHNEFKAVTIWEGRSISIREASIVEFEESK